jgi:ribonuclease Z
LENIYAEDLAYRAEFGRPIEAITEIEYHQMTDKTRVTADDWEVKARPVEHSIETYAYRIKETATQASCVYSADTGDGQPLIDFARDADILVHDCGVGPALDAPSTGTRVDRNSWSQFLETNPRPEDTPIADQHCDSTQAAEIATEADVDTLVLTHFLPVRDTRKIRKQAEAIFSGDVLIAEDGLTLRR